ncbi:MAG: amidophosphoribosyltransferase [Bdellovibrionales bacterium]|nr:amidophosphoribosyltransferase [Bdellovibrionales bacterium]
MASIGKTALQDVYYGLQLLQHRGQDGFGIYGYGLQDEVKVKRKTLVNQWPYTSAFNIDVAIGHNRYSTIGVSKESDLQPFSNQQISLCHNGNITNFLDQKRIWKNRDYAFTSNNDAEILLAYFSNVKKTSDIKDCVKEIFEEVKGSYSVVATYCKDTIFAFRDPFGIRPLVFGKKNDGYAFASETHVLEFLGYSEITEVSRGELIVIKDNKVLVREIIRQENLKSCMFEWVYFAGVEGKVATQNVYDVRFRLGKSLATTIKQKWKHKKFEPDLVAPVPDTSRTSALALAEELGLPYREVLIKNRYIQRSFILNNQTERAKAIEWKLNPIVSEIKDKKILLVDDSIVRGTTSKKIIKMLKDFGAKEVYLASACPQIEYPCYYGIDFPDKKELVASIGNEEAIANWIGVEDVTYLTNDLLKEAIGSTNICNACLTGEYPIEVNQNDFFEERVKP